LTPEDESWADDFAYGGKWSECFDRIAAALPTLVKFQFGYQSTYKESQYGVMNRDNCPVGISAQRYVCFDNGILPTHWLEAEGKGVLNSLLDDGFPIDVHKEALESDQKSLVTPLHELKPTVLQKHLVHH
jgi:hypothetical protein